MKSSQLQLKSYFFTRVFVEANKEFEVNDNFTECGNIPETKLEFAQDKKSPYNWQVVLNVQSSEKDKLTTPYFYDIKVVGYFEVAKDVSEKQMIKLVATNAPALLYGPAREQLANITGRGPLPGRYLPSVTFIDTTLTKLSSKKPKTRKTKKRS